MNTRRPDLSCALALFVAASCYFASFSPWNRPLLLDAATWDYMAVETARGLVPYRDVFLHKTPGAALIGAAGAAAGGAWDLLVAAGAPKGDPSHTSASKSPVLAAHALFLLMGALAPVLLFAIARTAGLPLSAALASGLALLAFDEWPIAVLEGCRPKVPTVFFGLAALLAAERRRDWAASLLGGLSVLCWQPGLAFLLGAWATIVRDGERRPIRFLQLGAVSVAPAGLLLLWLAAHGALADFFQQSVLFNVHYIEHKARPLLGTFRALLRTLTDWNDVEVLLAPAAAAGLWLGRARGASKSQGGLPFSVMVSGAVYAAMTFVSYQSWPDAILLTPILATLVGVGLHRFFALRLTPSAATALTLLVLTLAAIPDDRPKFHPPLPFDVQRERFVALAQDLPPDARVVGVSVPEFFLHTGRRNGWRWPYMWFGVDDFAAAHTAGGFEGVLADLERDPPRLILATRLWNGEHRELFEAWAAGRYERSVVRIYPHTRTPLRVYRLRKTGEPR